MFKLFAFQRRWRFRKKDLSRYQPTKPTIFNGQKVKITACKIGNTFENNDVACVPISQSVFR